MALKRFSEDDLVKKGFGMGKDGSFRRMPKLFGEALPVQEKKTKRKYRNNPTEYNGVRYDSEKEANYAKSLDFRLKSNDRGLVEWKGQVKMPIEVNGEHICNYIVDFKEHYEDGSIEYVDVKGFSAETGKFITTALFSLKKKLIESIYKINILIK